MRQVELTGIKNFECREVEQPAIGPGQANIAVKAIGICGSDIHAYYGEHPFMDFPIVLGHECTGIIEEISGENTKLKKGDRVVLRPQRVCGACKPCRAGRYNICEKLEVLGCQCPGGASDYYVADEDLFYRLPDNVGFDEGTLIEPLAVAVHAVKRAFREVEGKNILVLGAGTIGNLVAQSVKGMGARKVMITDISDFRLDLAKQCGIGHTVNISRQELAEEIEKVFGKDGIDAVYECTANEAALNQALFLSPKGIPIVVAGVFAGMPHINLANVQDREYTLLGTLMYVEEDYMESIDLVKQGKICLKRLITQKFGLDRMADAFRYIEQNQDRVQKVVLDI